MSQPDTQTVTVTAEKAQYCLESSSHRANEWPTPHNSLATGEDNWTAVLTGTQRGPVTVQLAVLDNRPTVSQQGWDMIVERDIMSESGEISVKNITDPEPVHMLRLPVGRYRLRNSAAEALAKPSKRISSSCGRPRAANSPSSSPAPMRCGEVIR
jgi:hypothetical protein